MKETPSLQFHDIEAGDRAAVDGFLRRHPTRKLNYCFPVLYLWRETCGFQIGFHEDFMLVRTFVDGRHNFLYPLGTGDISGAIEKLMLCAAEEGEPFRLFQISPDDRKTLESRFPGLFEFTLRRGESEYIYRSEKLAELAGSKLQHKRNHINYFENHYDWKFEPLTQANLAECRDFNREWFDIQRRTGDFGDTLRSEMSAIEKAFAEWDLLGLDGALLRADGRVAAYSVGCPLSADTYLVLFEKAFHDIRGASQQINRLFVRTYAKNHTYVNRAEDSNDEGLRQAKLSYHPDILEEVYSARVKQ